VQLRREKEKREGIMNSIAPAAWNADGARFLKVAVYDSLSFVSIMFFRLE